MRTIGIELQPFLDNGLLQIHSSRPTLHGLEQHLVSMHDLIGQFRPKVVAIDPISNFTMDVDETTVKPTLIRLIDFLKREKITALFACLTSGSTGATAIESSQVGMSSLMDTWFLLRNHEQNGERNRTIFVMKSRGMEHSNQVREFIISPKGVELRDAYLGEQGVLTGSARLSQETKDRISEELKREEHARKLRQIEIKRRALEAQIAVLRAEAEADAVELEFLTAHEAVREDALLTDAADMDKQRNKGTGTAAASKRRKKS
jgi:circadian clock protein KaiC